jgi:hypothetical protein
LEWTGAESCSTAEIARHWFAIASKVRAGNRRQLAFHFFAAFYPALCR